MTERQRLAILVGGGPAPGINSVISSATIRAVLEEFDVVGIHDGFHWLMQGDTEHVEPLTIDKVRRIHFRGGSFVGTSRANPTTDPARLERTARGLQQLGVGSLVTIGGDDTAFSAMKLAEHAGASLRVAHVPKTIDNDLSLPPDVDTFGYQTARHFGVQIVKNIMVDAHTTSRWYLVVTMGRKAGHLALGIGKAAAATVTLIPEEFGAGMIGLDHLTDILVGAIVKRRSRGRHDGVAVIAEGLALSLDPTGLKGLTGVEHDEHGHVRLSEIDLGDILKREVRRRLKELSIDITVVAKDIGYELRCADPIPYDMEYTRDLGYCATQFLIDGGTSAMITMQGGRFVPVPFSELLDPETGRTRVRLVDIDSTRFAIAQRYMLRLNRHDLEDDEEAARCAAGANLGVEAFRARFLPVARPVPGLPRS